MKLIALRTFRNTANVDLNGDGQITPDEYYIEKGQIFYIGGSKKTREKEFKDLSKPDQEMVALLAHAECVGDGNDEKLVDRINKEVKEQAAQDKRAKETAVAAGSSADVVQQLVVQLKALLEAAKAPAK